ncbi:hypothetical protein JW899_02675 [Candidatus Uhrbacteria bacterium]|nr:hypothetical protein [Candidatus Uhrbacteria bacterium]
MTENCEVYGIVYLGITPDRFAGTELEKIAENTHEFEGLKIVPQWSGTRTEYGLTGIGVALDQIQWFGELNPEKIRERATTVRDRFIRWLEKYGVKAEPRVMIALNLWED